MEQQSDFHPMVAIELSHLIPEDTITWLVKKIVTSRSEDGADLLARRHNSEDNAKNAILQIGASTTRLLEAAEIAALRKLTKHGLTKEFTMDEIEEFEGTDDLDSFLMPSEKQRLIHGCLLNIRASPTEDHIAGENQRLYPGEPIVRRMEREKLIVQMFPLHTREQLKRLEKEWYASAFWKTEPIAKVRRYFGQTVAMYFAFLHHYTVALIPPALIGVLYIILNTDTIYNQAFFAIFNMIWVTIFLETWKRKGSEYAYMWGSLDHREWEQPRVDYYGEMGINKITGKMEPVYSSTKRSFRYYCVSLPIICSCMAVAICVFCIYDYFYDMLRPIALKNQDNIVWGMIMPALPSAFYGVAIVFMNQIYRQIAVKLNDWENYRFQSTYDNQLIIKLVLFTSVNSFTSLCSIAFIKQDLKQLRTALAALLITMQILGQIQEVVIPYIQTRLPKKIVEKTKGGEGLGKLKKLIDYEEWLDIGKGMINDENEEDKQIELERHLPSSQGVIEDYTEMYVQFGYVFLFSAVFPPAALWAFLNNITEIKTDAFKFCRSFQRPFAQPTAGIGAWLVAFETLGIVAVMTNCALLALSPCVQENLADYGAVKLVFIFVAAEHILLLAKFILAVAIPDVPDWVQTAMKRQEYDDKQNWKKLIQVKSLRRRVQREN